MPGAGGWLVLIAGVAAGASMLGGVLALVHRTSTLAMSVAFGFAGGALIGTLTLQMIPHALQLGSIALVLGAFAAGFAAVYAFDLLVHGGQLAGEHAEQRRRVQRRYRRHPPLAGTALVLAAATSVEELVEGLAIGAGGAVEPALAVLIGLAIALDNLAEGLSIGELIRAEEGAVTRRTTTRTLLWTATVGVALFAAAVIGWAVLRSIDPGVLSVLVALGAGAMFYLTLGDLLPEGQARHYQQSTAVAAAIAFGVVMALSWAIS
jgi:ZIP family zinc transporter